MPTPLSPPPPQPLPQASDLCADGALSVANLRALLASRLLARKVVTLQDWFGQTDFALCRKHVDADGDARQDNVYVTVWKTWDFYFGIDEPVPRHGLRARLQRGMAALRGQTLPSTAQLNLLYRRHANGHPGRWQALDPHTAPDAWEAALAAWAGVLHYARLGLAQIEAGYPLLQQVQQTLSPEHIEAFAALPVFTERYNDWWDDDRNGFWQGDVWVGARLPGMYRGEPFGLALKLSWRNGHEAPGDAPDDAHALLLVEVDAARAGPPQVLISHAQRQSADREPVLPHAADHLARLLSMFTMLQTTLSAVQPTEAPTAGRAEGRLP